MVYKNLLTTQSLVASFAERHKLRFGSAFFCLLFGRVDDPITRCFISLCIVQVTAIAEIICNGGIWPGLVVAPDLPGRGRGVITTRHFSATEVVCHYNGELLDDATGKERYSVEANATGGYMYTFRHRGRTLWIDATEERLGPGRLINHSRCHANVSIVFY